MALRVSKSRTFAVILAFGEELGAYFLCKKTPSECLQPAFLEVDALKLPKDLLASKDAIIQLLVKAGLTVRFFDAGESQWMDNSTQYGLVRVKGNRDGSWGVPDLQEFEESYLKAM